MTEQWRAVPSGPTGAVMRLLRLINHPTTDSSAVVKPIQRGADTVSLEVGGSARRALVRRRLRYRGVSAAAWQEVRAVPFDDRPGRRYRNAPIVECVLELRVALPPTVTLEDLLRVGSAEGEAYPQRQGQFALQGTLQGGEDGASASAAQSQYGHVFLSQDGRRQFRATFDSFVFVQRAPYDRWADFHDEAVRLWRAYSSVTRPEILVRAGLRYVNKIDIPHPSVELKDYFRTTAELSPDLPQVIGGMFMQVQLPAVMDGVGANITTAVTAPPAPGITSVVLDIDAYSEPALRVPAAGFNEQLDALLARLREAKNAVFEACITDATRRVID